MNPKLIKLLSAALLLPSAASAALLSQDSFSGYGLGELPFVTNPAVTGYTGNWLDVDFGDAEPAVTAGSLAYAGANYATGSGNKVSVPNIIAGGETARGSSGRVNRLFDSSLTVTDATAGTRYLSFLFQSGQETGATIYQTLALYQGGFTDPNRNFDIGLTNNGGQTGTQYNFGADNAYTTTGVAADTNVHLLVVKFDFSATAASDSVTVWVDPVLGAGEPTGGVTVTGKDLTWDRLTLSDYDGNSCAWDDIRWGATFDNVTVDPVLPAVPTFTLQPSGYSGSVGDTVTLNALAESDPASAFQWQKSADGSTGWTDIDGAIAATLEFPSATYTDNGFYRVIATNANAPAPAGVASDVVQVSLTYPDPTITTQPVSTAAQVGSDVTLSVEANGLGNLTYQWYDGNNDPVGTNSNQLSFPSIQSASAGDYYVVITDDAGLADTGSVTTTYSNTVALSVFEPWSGLVSHEPFDTAAAEGYTVGELPGQTPTISGYTGAWTDIDGGNAEPAVASGSLTYANASYLGSTGDKVSVPTNITGGEIATDGSNSGRAYRMLDAPLVVDNGTTGTRYLSFLFQSGQETGATTYQMLSLSSNTTGNGIRPFDIGITADGGQSGTNYNFGVAGSYSSTGVAADTNVHLLVVKFELSATAASDNVTVWVDPTLGGVGDPTGGTTVSAVDLNWNRMFISDYDGNSAAWDEIRWGSTFDSVTLGSAPANDYAAWIASYPGVGSLTAFTDDADGDGIENGLENLFGTDPSVSNQGIVQVAKTGNTVTFQHPQNATPASNVSAAYVWSTDLATFNADGASAGGSTVSFATSTVAGTTTVTATITGTVPAKLFVAMKATQATP